VGLWDDRYNQKSQAQTEREVFAPLRRFLSILIPQGLPDSGLFEIGMAIFIFFSNCIIEWIALITSFFLGFLP
jgi:hypothetical protein